jgi:hypothetical protein
MSDYALDTMLVVRSLARELALQIGATYMPEDFAEAGGALVPLYHARRLGTMPPDVDLIVSKIETAVAADPHYRCLCCGALFGDTDDLALVTQMDVDLLRPGQIRPVGKCPVCRGKVHPHSPHVDS